METKVDISKYTLRARVIEGSLPMPQVTDHTFNELKADNYEIFCQYTLDNLKRLFDIGKNAYEHGELSKFEIMGWAGGVANEDGDRLLWSFRPDKYNFECIPDFIQENFYTAQPEPMSKEEAALYQRFWSPLKYGFSLAAYEAHISSPSLSTPESQIPNTEDCKESSENKSGDYISKPALDTVITKAAGRAEDHSRESQNFGYDDRSF